MEKIKLPLKCQTALNIYDVIILKQQTPNSYACSSGIGVYLRYGFTTRNPFGNFLIASSAETAGTTMASSPWFQFACVARLNFDVSCNESTTRWISLKIRPVDAG